MTIRVYLADDHKILRDSLVALLQQERDLVIVGEAANGQEALQEIVNLQPDIAILDISLPQLNGLEVAERVRRDYPAVKIIILTMHKSEDFIGRAYHVGVNGYVLKDNAFEELLKAIHTVNAGGTYLCSDITATVIAGFIKNYNEEKNKDQHLSSREREILQLIAEGNSNKEIAELLTLSVKTVETHRSHIMHKLDFKSVADLILYAVRNHIIEP